MSESEREAGIHWSVCAQEATRLVASYPNTHERTPEEVGEQIVKIGAEIWAWRQQCFPNGVVAQPARRPDNDPGPTPPNEWPEDKEAYDAISDNDPPPQGPVGQTPPRCRCGGAMEYKSADDWSAYFCTEQEKSRDPRVQAEQKKLHPPVWL